MREHAVARRPAPREVPFRAARRVLVVDDDPEILANVTAVLRSDPILFEPVVAGSAEAALRILGSADVIDCLLAEAALPGIDGLQLLLQARELRPDLKVVVMTSAPSPDLERAVLEIGAVRLLSKPFDFEDLLASVALDRPGALSHFEGDLDLIDVCRLSAACQEEGGVRVRHRGSEGILVHRGTTLVHAEVDGLVGAPAFEKLRSWDRSHFESISALRAAHLAINGELKLTDFGRRGTGKAGGTLRGLTLRHLIEWAMRGRQTCTLTVTSQRRTGILVFGGGKIRSAETADFEGGRAAAEILGWEGLRVELTRPRNVALAAPALPGSDFDGLIGRFCSEVFGFIATTVVRRKDGSSVGSRSAETGLDAAAAARCYAPVVDSHFAAIETLGSGAIWGPTEDLLITTANAYLLIRLLGDGHYHWLAVSSEANLALCRLLMRGYESLLLQELADLGEIPGRTD
jgi:CheY-like chemotaxis protein